MRKEEGRAACIGGLKAALKSNALEVTVNWKARVFFWNWLVVIYLCKKYNL